MGNGGIGGWSKILCVCSLSPAGAVGKGVCGNWGIFDNTFVGICVRRFILVFVRYVIDSRGGAAGKGRSMHNSVKQKSYFLNRYPVYLKHLDGSGKDTFCISAWCMR